MEMRNLTTFVTVTETGSFTKAAELLGYTQSTVSFQIRQLEEELNCQLFDRINHTISLTQKGQKLLSYALKILEETETFKENFTAAETPSGTVRMYSSDSICEMMMHKNYLTFAKDYPEIRLFFSTTDTDTMVEVLEYNEADCIFTLDNHIYRQDFITVREAPVTVHFVTGSSSPLSDKKDLTIRDILEYPFMLTEKGMSYRRILDEKLAQMSLQVDPVMETGRTDLIAETAASGNFVAFLPDFVTDELVREGKLVHLDVEGFEVTIWKQLIVHKNKWRSGALAAFLDFVKEHEFEW